MFNFFRISGFCDRNNLDSCCSKIYRPEKSQGRQVSSYLWKISWILYKPFVVADIIDRPFEVSIKNKTSVLWLIFKFDLFKSLQSSKYSILSCAIWSMKDHAAKYNFVLLRFTTHVASWKFEKRNIDCKFNNLQSIYFS